MNEIGTFGKDGGPITGLTLIDINGNPSIISKSVAANPVPLPIKCCGTAFRSVGSDGYLDYYFEVTGPVGASSVKLYMVGNLSVNTIADANGSDGLSLGTSLGGVLAKASVTVNGQVFSASSVNGSPPQDLHLNQVLYVPVNQPVGVSLNTQVLTTSAYACRCVGGEMTYDSSASAYVDPYFSLPASLVAAGYQVEILSPGIGNSPLGAPGPTPGAGLASLAFLVLAGMATKARGFLAR